MNSSSILLTNLRQLMKSKQYFNEIIHAYIVPTTDPHRVINSFSSVTYPEIWRFDCFRLEMYLLLQRCVSPALESVRFKIFGLGPDSASLVTLLIFPRNFFNVSIYQSLREYESQGILVGIFIIISLQLNFTFN